MLGKLLAGFVGSAIAVAPALAQDFSMPGTSPMDLAPQSQALTSSVIGNLSVGSTARGGGGNGRGHVPRGRVQGGLAFAPGARVSDARLPYASTPASRRQAMAEYLSRARQKNPKATAILAPELQRRNPHAELAPAFAHYGLRLDDAADVMAAFLVAGYDVMVGRDSTPAQVRGVRRQVAGQLVGNPAMRNPATRTRFAEELKLTTYIVGASEGSAKRDGSLADYRRGVATLYRQVTGENIAAWRMTTAGFAK